VTIASLERAIPADDRILLDSSCLIGHLDGSEAISPLATHVVDQLVKSGRNPATVAMVSVMEILVRPRRRALEEYEHVIDFLIHHPNLTAQAIDLAVAQEAATIRALFKLPTPDALVIATGVVCQVAHLITADKRWMKQLSGQGMGSRLRVLYLADHLPS
jgi:PIN domain nuclease of toxin-antitoxin system